MEPCCQCSISALIHFFSVFFSHNQWSIFWSIIKSERSAYMLFVKKLGPGTYEVTQIISTKIKTFCLVVDATRLRLQGIKTFAVANFAKCSIDGFVELFGEWVTPDTLPNELKQFMYTSEENQSENKVQHGPSLLETSSTKPGNQCT